MSRVVLDHTGENTLDYRLGTRAMVGLSVCHDKMPPEAAAEAVLQPATRLIVLAFAGELSLLEAYYD